MTKPKTMFGLCTPAALAVSAFGAQGASAQTAYECASTTSGAGFSDAHCKSAVASGAQFHHVAIPVITSTPITLTNVTTGTERSTAKLKTVQSGVAIEFQATEVEGTGTLEGKESGAETWAQGSGTITFKHATVTAPAGKGCRLTGETGLEGILPTKALSVTTKGLTSKLKILPASGTMFIEFTISGCSVAALNHVYTETGSVIGNTAGTTTRFTHAATTEQGTLFLLGQKAGLEGAITIKVSGTGNGVAFT